jgi:VHL beta domain
MISRLRTVLFCAVLMQTGEGFASDAKCKGERQLRSINSNVKTSVTFINRSKGTRFIYWIDYAGSRVLYQKLRPGSGYTQLTYFTHPWVATSSKGRCVGVYLPKRRRISISLN